MFIIDGTTRMSGLKSSKKQTLYLAVDLCVWEARHLGLNSHIFQEILSWEHGWLVSLMPSHFRDATRFE